MQKVDFALNANMQDFVDRLKSVQEVSPAPETQAIDPDGGQEKKRESQEGDAKAVSMQNKEEAIEAIVEDEPSPYTQDEVHLLDIRAWILYQGGKIYRI